MRNDSITRNEALFYMDMVDSASSPNHIPKRYKRKPYYKLLKNRNTNEFQCFIKVYSSQKHILNEKEIKILDDIYGFHKDKITMKQVAVLNNITAERVRQIIYKAERKITYSLSKKIK